MAPDSSTEALETTVATFMVSATWTLPPIKDRIL